MTNDKIQELIAQYSIGGVLRVWEFARAVEAGVLQHFSKSDPMGYQAYISTQKLGE